MAIANLFVVEPHVDGPTTGNAFAYSSGTAASPAEAIDDWAGGYVSGGADTTTYLEMPSPDFSYDIEFPLSALPADFGSASFSLGSSIILWLHYQTFQSDDTIDLAVDLVDGAGNSFLTIGGYRSAANSTSARPPNDKSSNLTNQIVEASLTTRAQWETVRLRLRATYSVNMGADSPAVPVRIFAAVLEIDNYIQSVAPGTVIEPAAGSLAISGQTPEFLNPSLDFSFVGEPPADSLRIQGLAPVATTFSLTEYRPPSGEILVTGQTPVAVAKLASPQARILLRLSGGVANNKSRKSLGGQAAVNLGGLINPQSCHVTSVGVSGLKVIGANGAALGTHQLSWDAGQKKLTWVDPAANEALMYEVGGLSIYRRSTQFGELHIEVTPERLPTTSTVTEFAVTPTRERIFDNIRVEERAADHVNYRCLFIQNFTDKALSPFNLQLVAQPQHGSISVGSEFLGSFGSVTSADVVEQSQLNMFGRQKYAAYPVLSAEDEIRRYEYAIVGNYPSPSSILVQISDGVSSGLPPALVDEEDSTALLSAVEFGTELSWLSLPANGFVSFWMKRTVASGSSGAALTAEDFSFNITYGGA